MKSFREFHFFVIGCLIGSTIVLVPFYFFNRQKSEQKEILHNKIINRMRLHQNDPSLIYDVTLSQILFEKVKILCMVMTYPENHRKKATHVRDTWGKRCNKLIFMSSKDDLQLETVVLPFGDSRSLLWNKTKASFQYAYDKHINEFDWFLKADDDK